MARRVHGNAVPWMAALGLAWSAVAGAQPASMPGMRTASSGVASPPVHLGKAFPGLAAPLTVESRTARGRAVLPEFPVPRPEPDGSHLPAEDLLLHLQLQEQSLLEDFGPDHPDVASLRSRLEVTRRHVEDCRRQALELERSRIPPPAAPHPVVIRTETPPAPPPVVVVVAPAPAPTEPAPVATSFAETPVPAAEATPVPPSDGTPVPLVEPAPYAAPAPPPVLSTASLAASAVVFAGLAVQGGVLVWLLRRGRRLQAGPLRVELLNTPGTVLGPVSVPVENSVVPSGLRPVEPPATSSAEEAVYRQLLEQNLRLRAEIHDLEAIESCSPGDARPPLARSRRARC